MTLTFQIMVFMILFLAMAVATSPIKLENTTTNLKDEIKCGETCYNSPPPPKPSPSPPPPPKKPPKTPDVNCPPPPPKGGGGGSGQAPPDYIYIAGPPKNLYPVVQSISAARPVAPELMVLSGLLIGVLAFW